MNRHKSGWGTLTLAFAVLSALAVLATPVVAASSASETCLWVAQTGIDRDGKLDPAEIARLERIVVLIGNMQRGRIVATGSGTLVSPEGLILTNAHVVEGAEQVAVGMLDDSGDPPRWRYLGEVVIAIADEHVDVALIALRGDMHGRRLTSFPDLPDIPLTEVANEVRRGDTVYIFGYPGIGDDYLVMTQGNISSVENGVINGQRMPVRYLTDAEIAPGNSGGLVVNGNGEFVGIPTFVQTEDVTGGRLGGILPGRVALMAVQGDYHSSSQPAPGGPSCAGAPPPRMVVGYFGRVTFTTGEAVRVRTGPGTNYRIRTYLPEGTVFYVTGGPVCAGGYWWWSVRTSRGITGWMAEGVVGNYFIEPFGP